MSDDSDDAGGPENLSGASKAKHPGDYEVGYKKPPIATQFQPGHKRSKGKGRPRKALNLKTDLIAELSEMVTLKENGKAIRMSKQRALIKSTTLRGIKGSDRSTAKIFDLAVRLLQADQPAEAELLSDEDEAILNAYFSKNGGSDATG